MSSYASFVALVPVKQFTVGKSRLADLPPERRAALARAFALDTIAACRAASAIDGVIVVTDDVGFAGELGALTPDCVVIPDGVSGNLNASLEQAAHEAVRRWPGLGIAAICADLPALRPDELTAALASVVRTGFVPDEAGTGTTVYAARTLPDFQPAFGGESAARHAGAGAEVLLGHWPSVRHDVDDAGALARALVLGVGPHTMAALGL